jgi:ubiquinone/menaquinone biosynthesis C-methylase UbiE
MRSVEEIGKMMQKIPLNFISRGLDNSEIISFFQRISLREFFLRGDEVLEIGCGTGKLSADLARDYNVTSHAIDVQDNVAECYRGQINFQRADATALPFSDSSFDRAFSYFVFHYIPDKLKALSEIHRVLRVGGEAVIDFDNLIPCLENQQRENQYLYPNLEDILYKYDPVNQVFAEGIPIFDRVKNRQRRVSQRVRIKKKSHDPLVFPDLQEHTIQGVLPMSRSVY